jgi:hypothetical protein
MFAFARIHHSPDSEGYYVLVPMGAPDLEARFGPPHFRMSGERGQWVTDYHRVGILTLFHDRHHGNKRTWMALSVKDGLTDHERESLRQEVMLFAHVPDSTNAGHRAEVMQGWFFEESFYPAEAKPQDCD